MLMVTESAIEFRPVVRRGMGISRLDPFCLFRKFCRAAMAGNALLYSRNFRFISFSVTLFTGDVCQQMIVASRQFSPQIPVLVGMTFFAGLKPHGFGARMRQWQFFVVSMTPGAVSTPRFRRFHRGCQAGLTECNHRQDTVQNISRYHCAVPFTTNTNIPCGAPRLGRPDCGVNTWYSLPDRFPADRLSTCLPDSRRRGRRYDPPALPGT